MQLLSTTNACAAGVPPGIKYALSAPTVPSAEPTMPGRNKAQQIHVLMQSTGITALPRKACFLHTS